MMTRKEIKMELADIEYRIYDLESKEYWTPEDEKLMNQLYNKKLKFEKLLKEP